MPPRGKIYSVNEGNYKYFDEPCKKYVDQVKQKYSARYVGSMVSDIHRTLLYGNVTQSLRQSLFALLSNSFLV
jgi:fructose-1,6-bisphosphatase I